MAEAKQTGLASTPIMAVMMEEWVAISSHVMVLGPSKQTRKLEKPLKGSINIVFADGHTETVQLVNLYRSEWHKDYVVPVTGR